MQKFHTECVTWEADYNLESGITLSVRHSNAAFRICCDPQILAASPPVLERHHRSLEILYKDDAGDEYCELVERLRKPSEEGMTQMAPNPTMESSRYLHTYLYPLWFIFEARVAEGSSHIQPHFKVALSRQEFPRPVDYVDNELLQPYLSSLLNSKLNKYSSRQVQGLAQTSHLVPSKVLVDNNEYFFKLWRLGRVCGYHELQAYRKILADTEASPPLLADIRICYPSV